MTSLSTANGDRVREFYRAQGDQRTTAQLTRWLIDNNIIRESMDATDGFVALNCYTGETFTFDKLGATNGNN